MDFRLSEEQQMLADSIQDWTRDNYSIEVRRKASTSEDGHNREVWRTFADLGWLALMFSEDDGGLAGGPEELLLLMEQFGRALVAEPFLATVVLAGGIAKRACRDEQRQQLIDGIVSGELQATLAFVEPQARYDLANVATRAVADGGGYRINGSKAVVLNGGAADKLVVVARTDGEQCDPHGISLFLMDAGLPGISSKCYKTQDGAQAADITFGDVRVAGDALIGDIGEGLDVLESVIDEATFAVSAEAVGIMGSMLDGTVEYSKNRRQFGVPIGTFQALQHRMADMYNECEQARSIVLWACSEMQVGQGRAARAISAGKSYVGEAARFVGQQAIQIHGGIGVTDEIDIAHYFKRLSIIEVLFGNTDYHVGRYASHMTGRNK